MDCFGARAPRNDGGGQIDFIIPMNQYAMGTKKQNTPLWDPLLLSL